MIKFSYMSWLMGRWCQVNLSCFFDSAVTECLITKWVFWTYFLGQTTHFKLSQLVSAYSFGFYRQ